MKYESAKKKLVHWVVIAALILALVLVVTQVVVQSRSVINSFLGIETSAVEGRLEENDSNVYNNYYYTAEATLYYGPLVPAKSSRMWFRLEESTTDRYESTGVKTDQDDYMDYMPEGGLISAQAFTILAPTTVDSCRVEWKVGSIGYPVTFILLGSDIDGNPDAGAGPLGMFEYSTTQADYDEYLLGNYVEVLTTGDPVVLDPGDQGDRTRFFIMLGINDENYAAKTVPLTGSFDAAEEEEETPALVIPIEIIIAVVGGFFGISTVVLEKMVKSIGIKSGNKSKEKEVAEIKRVMKLIKNEKARF